jgi:hypothetical protein
VHDHRTGSAEPDDPLFTDRHGRALTGNAVRKLFERLKTRTGIRDLCAHMLRHTWATNFHRSGSGSRFDIAGRGRLENWTDGRAVLQSPTVRGASQSTLAVHRIARRAEREAACREAALTAEKRPDGNRAA